MDARSSQSMGSWGRPALLLTSIGWGANHFAPLLPVYRATLGLDAAAPALLFGVYALGLFPGLLLAGPCSDRLGRRAVVMPAAVATLLVSLGLAASASSFAGLLLGRFAYGLAAGVAMGPGAVWVAELSAGAGVGAGARRATIALTSGFALGPLVSALLAEFGPAPTRLPYAVHILFGLAAVAWCRPVGDVATGRRRGPLLAIHLDRASWARFALEVVPVAPFVFTFPTVSFTAIPAMLGAGGGNGSIVMTGVLAALTLFSGVLAQPLTRRFGAVSGARLGLGLGAAGLVLAAAAVSAHATLALPFIAPVLGSAYGITVTSGLRLVDGIAPPESRGGLTGLYYVLTYLGFSAPFGVALTATVVHPPLVLLMVAGVTSLALGFHVLVGPARS